MATISGREGETVEECATLSDIPTNGLECDIVLQLKTMSGSG